MDKKVGNLNHFLVPVHDFHVIIAKEWLKDQGHGHIVEAVEQHYDLTHYKTSFAHSGDFSDAYTDDLLDCLDLAHKQNVTLLNDYDLADCLKQ